MHLKMSKVCLVTGVGPETGTGAEIGFSVASGAITAVTLSDPGSGYTNGDVLSVDPAFDGVGSGSNFS